MKFVEAFRFLFMFSVINLHFTKGSNSSNPSLCTTSLLHADANLFSQPMTSLISDLVSAPRIRSPGNGAEPYSYLFLWELDSRSNDVGCFKIRYRIQKEFQTNWTYDTVRSNISQLRLTGLESWTLYDVEIISVTNHDEASRVISSSFRTGFAKNEPSPSFPSPSQTEKNPKSNTTASVPDPPANLKVVVTSKTSVSLTWVPRSNGGFPITGYKVQIRTMGGKRGKWKTKSVLQADHKACNIKGLRRDTSYKFRVIAINKKGDSKPSQIAKQPSPDPQLNVPPDACVKLLANGSVSFRWTFDIIPRSIIDGFIVDYRYFIDGERKRKRKKIRNPQVSSYEIPSPIQSVEYMVEVKAFNTLEKSPASHVVRFTIMRDHAMKRDKIRTLELCDEGSINTGHPNIASPGGDPDSSVLLNHNNVVKSSSNDRDIGIIIGGSVLCLVIFVLLSTCICYHKQRKAGRRKKHVHDLAEGPSSICTKLFGSICRQPKPDSPPTHNPSTPQPRCSCYSGTSSPARANASCLQSNRTSMSHNPLPENGVVAYPRVPGSPSMYTVYYDYPTSRVPPHCLQTPGIPICWLRGEGEFCHIVPHETRPKASEDPSCQDDGSDAANVTQAASSSRAASAEQSESEPEQVALLETRDVDKAADET